MTQIPFSERLAHMDMTELRAECERLLVAKRNALKVADALAKENVELRGEIARLRREARRRE